MSDTMINKFLSIMPGLVLFSLISVTTACKPGVSVIQIESEQANLSPMLVGAGSVFMKIMNTGTADDSLTSARVEIAGTITELHDVQDGKMIKVESIRIPRNGIVELRPGKLHLMIFKLPREAREGFEVPLVLSFRKAGEKKVLLKLMNPAPYPSPHS